jgi:hypothetical protein
MRDRFSFNLSLHGAYGALKPKSFFTHKPIPTLSTKHLNSLRANGVQKGKKLNPYGRFGNTQRSRYRLGDLDHLAYRPNAMRRARLKLKQNRAVALEAHELQQMARENAKLAMETLIEISNNKRAPEATRIAASIALLDRGYGRSSQTSITANVSNGKNSDLTVDELDKRTAKALKRIEELTNRTPKTPAGENRPAHVRKLH